MDAKPLRIRFVKVNGVIKIYLISEKNHDKHSINHNFVRIRIDSCNSLPREKTSTFHNFIILQLLTRIKINTTKIFLKSFL